MLNAFQRQLKLMAADNSDPFTEIIRKAVGPREAVRYEGPLRALILAMPAMVGQIRGWTYESKTPSPVKRLHAFVMAYLYSPEDLLPESSLGFFGYLDDAYLVAQVYNRTVIAADCFGLKRFAADEALSGEVPAWLKTVKEFLPEETAVMDRMLEAAVLQRDGDFSKILSLAAKDGEAARRRISKARK